MFVAKAEVITGSTTTSVIAGLSFAHDVMPIISEIGICAGTIVALHGVWKILYHHYWRLKYSKKHEDHLILTNDNSDNKGT